MLTVNIWEMIILAILQGLSEFLPISSSGHLVILESLLGIQKDNITLEIALHFGTLLAILIVFWDDIRMILKKFFRLKQFQEDQEVRLFYYIILASVPAALVGILAKKPLEQLFGMPRLTALMLILTGLFLLLTRVFNKTPRKELSFPMAFLIGIAQAVAIIPGISRSGMTVGTSRMLGLSPQRSVSFSFLLAIPAISGAAILEVLSIRQGTFKAINLPIYLTGVIVAMAVGIVALKLLIKFVQKEKLYVFGIYCLFIGLFFLFLY
ncbi:undecaprenyl-diphosphate phosphatase [bacterium]|nr:undecaprenyl-diphosphate phosphatase [bacterium]